MKKTLISMAVAAAMAAPAAAMAEAILYGKLHVSIDYADVSNAAAVPTYNRNGTQLTKGLDFKGWGVNANGDYMPGAGRANRVGVKGSEDLGNGLKAIYQVELGVNFGDNNIPGGYNGISVRNSFVGLAGGFGSFLVGRHDTPLKISTGKLDMFADTMADYNGTVGFQDLRVDNGIAYISPSFSGFQFMGALVAPGGATADGAENVNSDQLNGAYSLAGIYSNGPFFASLAYESLSNEMFMNTAVSEAGDGVGVCRNAAGARVGSCNYVGDDFNKWRIGLGLLDWNGFTLSAVYEDQSDLAPGQQWTSVRSGQPVYGTANSFDASTGAIPLDGFQGQSLWQIQTAYAFGNNQVKAMYGQVSRDYDDNAVIKNAAPLGQTTSDAIGGDRNTWAIAFDHNFSKRTKAYVLYTEVDEDLENFVEGSDWSGFSMGMIHKF
ncbi:porin [Rhabdochromatium marinum]|uniref:porin n=1 Tax=Rhabdochromatium marinum TaxID=48729 RepID=UPI0019073CDA|nr:porin [Rhabdochromatium marinum]MBK1648654.1 porin [Rhabdochromatium marinum]